MLVSDVTYDQPPYGTCNERTTKYAKTFNQVGILIVRGSWREEYLGDNVYLPVKNAKFRQNTPPAIRTSLRFAFRSIPRTGKVPK